MVAILVVSEVGRSTDSLLVHFQELFLDIDPLGLELFLGLLELVLCNLELIGGSKHVLQVHVGLSVKDSLGAHFGRVVEYWIRLSSIRLLFLARDRSCSLPA